MSKILIEHDEKTNTKVYAETCVHTGNTVYTRDVDTSDIIKEVERRRENSTGKLTDMNSFALFPAILIEKWEKEINGENILNPEHKAFYKMKVQSVEARPYIINRGLIT